MAIPADTVWEVRPTNGDNTFGGAFADSQKGATGVDYTQQTTAQLSLTDLATSGAGSTTLTSVTGGFTNLMLGNAIRINSGTNFQVGFYIITGFTNGNTVTLDRTPSSGGAGSGGNGKVGGATKSFTGQTTTTLVASMTAGNTVYVKQETWNESVTTSVAGASTTPMTIEGYKTTRGDGTTAANRPINNRGSAGAPIVISHAFYFIKHLCFTGSNAIGASSGAVTDTVWINCASYSNGSIGFNGNAIGTRFIACEAYSNTTVGFNGVATAIGCYSHDNTTTGFNCSAAPTTLINCISEANGSHGLATNNVNVNAINCTFDGNTGGSTNGLNASTVLTGVFLNCIFSNNGQFGMAATSAGLQKNHYADYNDLYGNGTARQNFVAGANDSSADPAFTNRASGDFTPGVALKGTGFPGAFPGGTSTGYLDIGAVQRFEPAGGGSYVA